MRTTTYLARRHQLTTYFDHTAAAAWRALTSNDPVSRVRATVRAGRDEMRATLLDWLPADLEGQTVLDAGCGTGALAIEAAQRGARVIAIDVASSLVEVAERRAGKAELRGSIEFRVGDMLADAPAEVDHIVAMDSLVHYDAADVEGVVADFATRARQSIVFTSAPWTVPLALMHFTGRLIPHRSHRAPAIEPIHIRRLLRRLESALGHRWVPLETVRIQRGFYISQAIGLRRR